jgi:hypothetical protein
MIVDMTAMCVCACNISRGSGLRQQRNIVALQRGRVDLGSVLLRANTLRAARASFLPQAFFTRDMYARDYFLVEQVVKELHALIRESNRTTLSGERAYSNEAADRKKSSNSNNISASPDTPPLSAPFVQLVHAILLFHQ